MIRIGDFSRLSQVSVKTLRYYDELGLLKPADVDEQTGYRYYTAAQLLRLHRILALKDLGLALEQIVPILRSPLSPRFLQELLQAKQEELRQRVHDEQARLARVEARLRQIEQEGKMSDYEVVVKRVETLPVASVRAVIPDVNMIGPTISGLFGEVFAHIGKQGVQPVGSGLDRYLDPDFQDHDIAIEVAVPVERPFKEGERVKYTTLPAVETMASAVHQGPFDGLSGAFSAVAHWIEANGYRIDGPAREVYLQYDPHGDPAQYVTEVQFPVTKT